MSQEIFTKALLESSHGTCLQGYVQCSYKHLIEVLGEPLSGGYDDRKSDAEWVLLVGKDKEVVTIYNYKDGKNYCGEKGLDVEDIEEWHIGGKKKEIVALVKNILSIN